MKLNRFSRYLKPSQKAAMRGFKADTGTSIAEHQELKADYALLQASFDELLEMHNKLIADMKRPRRAPVAASLLGGHHGWR